MTWGDLAERCAGELERVRAGLPELSTFFPVASTAAVTLVEHEQATDEAVSAAVRQFASDGTWPQLTGLERTMLSFRLEWAASLASLLEEQPGTSEPSEPVGDENHLGWMMLFAWDQVGFPRLQETLERFLGTPRRV